MICAALWRISFRPPRGLGRAENPEHRSKTIQTSNTPRPSLAPPEGQTFAFGAAGNANVHIERRVRARVGRPAVTVSDWPAQLVRLQRGMTSEQLAASRFEGGFRARGGGQCSATNRAAIGGGRAILWHSKACLLCHSLAKSRPQGAPKICPTCQDIQLANPPPPPLQLPGANAFVCMRRTKTRHSRASDAAGSAQAWSASNVAQAAIRPSPQAWCGKETACLGG